MPTVITTSTGSTATAYSNQRKIDRCQNGVLWALYWDGTATTSTSMRTRYSTDSGATWTDPGASSAFGFVSTGATYTPSGSIFIDLDDYAHVAYKDRHDGKIYYRRGTPNAGRTAWTWSSAVVIDSTAAIHNYPDIVAHREGTGWQAHIIASSNNASNNNAAIFSSINITSGGTIGTPSRGSLTAWSGNFGMLGNYGLTVDTWPSIDFNHTGDGKTVAGGTPHLYAAWSAGATGAGKGIRFKKAAYSAGTWTWGTEREIDSTRYISTATSLRRWLTCLFDGTRVIIPGYLDNDLGDLDVVLYDRDVADTATTTRVLVAATGVASVDVLASGSATYDASGNVYLIGRDGSGGVNSRALKWRKWTRASNTLGATTTIDSNSPDNVYVSAKRGYSSSRIEFIYTDDTASPYAVTYDGISLNTAPNAPTVTGPASGALLDRAVTQRFSWTFSDPDAGDSQSKFDLQYRLVGAGTWTTVTTTTTSNFHDFAPSALAAGDYEWQVRTYDAVSTVGPWSALSFFTMANAPAAPTITAPTNGATVPSTTTVTWSVGTQTDYQVRTVADNAGAPNTAVVYTDTGAVTSTSARARSVAFPVNGRYEHVQVRIKNSGLWSSWASARVLVSFLAPAVPTLVVAPVNPAAMPADHALSVTTTHPAPTGGQPTVTSMDVLVRENGDTGDGVRVAAGLAPGAVYVWTAPRSGITYQVRVRAYGDNATNTYSAWTTATGVATVKGVLLHDPADPTGTIRSFRFNNDGAVDTVEVESASLAYAGRVYPVVEFGIGATRTVEVPTIMSKGPGDAAALRVLVERRAVLCYRDSKGRKVYGVLTRSVHTDTAYGVETSASFAAVDYTEAV